MIYAAFVRGRFPLGPTSFEVFSPIFNHFWNSAMHVYTYYTHSYVFIRTITPQFLLSPSFVPSSSYIPKLIFWRSGAHVIHRNPVYPAGLA